MTEHGDVAVSSPPKWFWLASALGLVWNSLGVVAFFVQMTMDLSELPEAERLFHETTPIWATLAFAVAVFGGTLGCVALLLRKSWAFIMLLVCVLGIVVQISHSLFVSNGIEVFGPEGIIMPILTFGIALLLTWFAYVSKKNGWIR